MNRRVLKASLKAPSRLIYGVSSRSSADPHKLYEGIFVQRSVPQSSNSNSNSSESTYSGFCYISHIQRKTRRTDPPTLSSVSLYAPGQGKDPTFGHDRYRRQESKNRPSNTHTSAAHQRFANPAQRAGPHLVSP